MTSMSLPGLTRQSIETKDASRLRIEVLGSSPRTALDRFALKLASFSSSFAGLVVLARSLNPIPSRTRPLNSSAPMVLWLKPWESRSLPGLPRTSNSSLPFMFKQTPLSVPESGVFVAVLAFLTWLFLSGLFLSWLFCRRFVAGPPRFDPMIGRWGHAYGFIARSFQAPYSTGTRIVDQAEEPFMREFVRPLFAPLSAACLVACLTIMLTGAVLAQAKSAPAQQGAPMQPPPFKQVALTDKQIEGVIASS